jgi:hypothetical protein
MPRRVPRTALKSPAVLGGAGLLTVATADRQEAAPWHIP